MRTQINPTEFDMPMYTTSSKPNNGHYPSNVIRWILCYFMRNVSRKGADNIMRFEMEASHNRYRKKATNA